MLLVDTDEPGILPSACLPWASGMQSRGTRLSSILILVLALERPRTSFHTPDWFVTYLPALWPSYLLGGRNITVYSPAHIGPESEICQRCPAGHYWIAQVGSTEAGQVPRATILGSQKQEDRAGRC